MGGQKTFFPLRSNSQLNYNYGSYLSYSYSTFTDNYLLTEPSMFSSHHYPPIILPTYLPTYLPSNLPTYVQDLFFTR
jgi:hypothetical protein